MVKEKAGLPWVVAGVAVIVAVIAVFIALKGDKGPAGTLLWEFKTGDAVVSSPAIGSDGTVYVGSNDNKLYAIRTESLGLAQSPWPMRGQNAQHTGRVMKM